MDIESSATEHSDTIKQSKISPNVEVPKVPDDKDLVFRSIEKIERVEEETNKLDKRQGKKQQKGQVRGEPDKMLKRLASLGHIISDTGETLNESKVDDDNGPLNKETIIGERQVRQIFGNLNRSMGKSYFSRNPKTGKYGGRIYVQKRIYNEPIHARIAAIDENIETIRASMAHLPTIGDASIDALAAKYKTQNAEYCNKLLQEKRQLASQEEMLITNDVYFSEVGLYDVLELANKHYYYWETSSPA